MRLSTLQEHPRSDDGPDGPFLSLCRCTESKQVQDSAAGGVSVSRQSTAGPMWNSVAVVDAPRPADTGRARC